MRAVTAIASPPLPRMASAASSQGPWLRPEIVTLAPASAKPSAIARPMPRDDPVTIATFPLRSKSWVGIRLHPLAYDRVAQGADAGDLDFADVAMLQVARPAVRPHPDDVARIQRQILRHPAEELGDAMDHVVGRETVGDLVIDPHDRLRRIEVEIGLDPRPHGLERVGVLGAPQGAVAPLPSALAHVVADGPAEHDRQRIALRQGLRLLADDSA